MNEIVVIGTCENRKKIINDLADDFEIIAYSDIETKQKKYSIFDYVPYIKIGELKNLEFRYAIIAYTSLEDIKLAERELTCCGIDIKNIISYELFKENLFIDPCAYFLGHQNSFDSVLFGMSHSQCAVQPQYLKKRLYKFACPSMDLFCQRELIKRIANSDEQLDGVNTCIFEVPYYIFNYDLSKFRGFVINRLFYFHLFKNYHHFGEKSGEKEIIVNFENYITAFNKDSGIRKFSLNKELDEENGTEKTSIIRLIVRSLRQNYKILRLKDDVWFQQYHETMEENREIFYDCIKMLQNLNPSMKILILICPFNPAFIKMKRKVVNRQKEIFYESLRSRGLSFEIIDHFEMGKKYKFSDHCHFSIKSSIEYSKLLNEILINI